MKIKIKTLFDQKHIVATASALIILLTVVVFGVDAAVSGAAGDAVVIVEEIEAPIAPAEDAQDGPAASSDAPATEADSGSIDSGNPPRSGGSNDAPEEEPEEEEDSGEEEEGDSNSHSKVGEVTVGAGEVVAFGALNS